MMKSLAIAVPILVAAALVAAQVEERKPANDERPMSMMAMMQQCQEQCGEMRQSMTELTGRIDEARKSNDPARMRAALDDASTRLSRMQSHMNECTQMMKMMEATCGRMMQMMGDSPAEKGQPQKSR